MSILEGIWPDHTFERNSSFLYLLRSTVISQNGGGLN